MVGLSQSPLETALETARWLCQAEEGAFRLDWARVAVFGYYAGTTLSRADVAGRLERSQIAMSCVSSKHPI